MKRFGHPTLGRFTRDEFDRYCQRLRGTGRRAVLTLDLASKGRSGLTSTCGVSDDRGAGSWERLVEQAARIAPTRCLETVNRICEFERKPALTSEQLRKRIRLVDLSISRGAGRSGSWPTHTRMNTIGSASGSVARRSERYGGGLTVMRGGAIARRGRAARSYGERLGHPEVEIRLRVRADLRFKRASWQPRFGPVRGAAHSIRR